MSSIILALGLLLLDDSGDLDAVGFFNNFLLDDLSGGSRVETDLLEVEAKIVDEIGAVVGELRVIGRLKDVRGGTASSFIELTIQGRLAGHVKGGRARGRWNIVVRSHKL